MPWLLTGWDSREPPAVVVVLGAALIVVGAGVLLHAFARFVLEGRGTPAPIAPTERLVVGGLYRHVRNPMYLAVGATIVGQALVLGRWGLVVYAAAFLAVVAAFVRFYEEPTLSARYGEEYAAYRRAVPAGGRGCGLGRARVGAGDRSPPGGERHCGMPPVGDRSPTPVGRGWLAGRSARWGVGGGAPRSAWALSGSVRAPRPDRDQEGGSRSGRFRRDFGGASGAGSCTAVRPLRRQL